MAVLGLRVCHRPGPISYRRLFSAITSSLVDKAIDPDNTRRLPDFWNMLMDLPKTVSQEIRGGPRIFDPRLKYKHTDLLRLLGKAKVKDGHVLYSSTRDADDLELSLIDLGFSFLEERGLPKVSTCVPGGKYDLPIICERGIDHWIPKAVLPFRAYPSDEGIRPSQLPIRYASDISLCLNALVGDNDIPVGPKYQTRLLGQYCITGPNGDESSNMCEELLKNCEDFYGALGISYRVVARISPDGSSCYDLQGWFPASRTYRMLACVWRYTDRHLFETQYCKRSNEHPGQRVHLLRSTFMVTEFTISSVLEYHQREDGVEVPEVLGLYMGGKSFLPFRFKYGPLRGRVPRRRQKKRPFIELIAIP